MPSATDIITYIGVPLAVLGVLPILWTALRTLSLYHAVRKRLDHNLKNPELRSLCSTNTDVLSGKVDVEFKRIRLWPLSSPVQARDAAEAFRTRSMFPGGSWTAMRWQINELDDDEGGGAKSYTVTSAQLLRQPPAIMDFAALFAQLMDLGALPVLSGLLKLRQDEQHIVPGTVLFDAPLDDVKGCGLRQPKPQLSNSIGSMTAKSISLPKTTLTHIESDNENDSDDLQECTVREANTSVPGDSTAAHLGGGMTTDIARAGIETQSSADQRSAVGNSDSKSVIGHEESNIPMAELKTAHTPPATVEETAKNPDVLVHKASEPLKPEPELYNYRPLHRRHESPATSDRGLLVVATRKDTEDDSNLALRLEWMGLKILTSRTNELGHISVCPKIVAIRLGTTHCRRESRIRPEDIHGAFPRRLFEDMDAFRIPDSSDAADLKFCCILDKDSVRQAHRGESHVQSHKVQSPNETGFLRLSRSNFGGDLFRSVVWALAMEDEVFCSYTPPEDLLQFCERAVDSQLKFSAFFTLLVKIVTPQGMEHVGATGKLDRIGDLPKLYASAKVFWKYNEVGTRQNLLRKRLFEEKLEVKFLKATKFHLKELNELLLYWLSAEMGIKHVPTECEVVEWTAGRMLNFSEDAKEVAGMMRLLMDFGDRFQHDGATRQERREAAFIEGITDHRFSFAIVLVCISFLAKHAARARQCADTMRACTAQWKDVLLY